MCYSEVYKMQMYKYIMANVASSAGGRLNSTSNHLVSSLHFLTLVQQLAIKGHSTTFA